MNFFGRNDEQTTNSSFAFDQMLDKMGLQKTQDIQEESGHSTLTTIGLFGLGMALGAGIGMMFAPRRGKELRSKAKERAQQTFPSASQKLQGQEGIHQSATQR